VVRSRAVQVAIGIDWEGRRQVLGVELANQDHFKQYCIHIGLVAE